MATTNDPQVRKPWLTRKPPWPRQDGLFRFTVNQFYQLDELGFFDDRHVELIEGIIHEMTANPPHCVAMGLATNLFHGIFGGECADSSHLFLRCGSSFPA